MKAIYCLFFLHLLLVDLAWAAEASSAASECAAEDFLSGNKQCEISTKFVEKQGGFREAPVIACPRPSKTYSDLIDALENIKAQIKKESCAGAVNEGIEAKLENLVGNGRSKFVQTLKEGFFGEGQISTEQVKNVTNYVEGVVREATNVITIMNRNENCFEDDEQRLPVLSYVSAAISEVSGAVGSLAGPFGAKINLAGQLGGTLLGGVGKLVEAQKRKGYQFDDGQEGYQNIKNYFNTLCTYYDFKENIDELTGVFVDEDVNLYVASEKVNSYLAEVPNRCFNSNACSELIASYEDWESQRTYGVVTPTRGRLTAADPMLGEEPGRPQALVESDELDVILDFGNGTLEENLKKFKKAFPGMVEEFEERKKTAERRPVPTAGRPIPSGRSTRRSAPISEAPALESGAPAFEAAIGLLPLSEDGNFEFARLEKKSVKPANRLDATLRALRLRTWIKSEQKRREDKLEELGEDGFKRLKKVQNQIEDVLVRKEAKRYLEFIIDGLDEDIENFQSYADDVAFDVVDLFVELKILSPLQRVWDNDQGSIGVFFDQLYGEDINFTSALDDALLTDMQKQRREAQFNSWKTKSSSLLADVVNSHQLVVKRCLFFKNSQFEEVVLETGFRSGAVNSIKELCDVAAESLTKSLEIIRKVLRSEFPLYSRKPLEKIFEAQENFVASWVESIIVTVDQDLENLEKN